MSYQRPYPPLSTLSPARSRPFNRLGNQSACCWCWFFECRFSTHRPLNENNFFLKKRKIMDCKMVVTSLLVLCTFMSLARAIGFPSGGGGGGCCCCPSGGGGYGGGCGGGCGRRKRDTDAVQPHFKADETPCPQTAWKEMLAESISADDAVASVNAIQTALYRRYADDQSQQKFLVTCASADEGAKVMANKVHFSSSGDGYCNLVKERIWCQAVAMSA